MRQPATNAFETWVEREGGGRARLHGSGAPPVAVGSGPWEGGPPRSWTAEELLTGAVEVSVMLAFLQRAEQRGLRPLFYQSSAEGRVVVEDDGTERLTDLIVRPRLGVRDEQEASLAGVLFEELPGHCRLSLMLRSLPRIQPIVEVWPATEEVPAPGVAVVVLTPG